MAPKIKITLKFIMYRLKAFQKCITSTGFNKINYFSIHGCVCVSVSVCMCGGGGQASACEKLLSLKVVFRSQTVANSILRFNITLHL